MQVDIRGIGDITINGYIGGGGAQSSTMMKVGTNTVTLAGGDFDGWSATCRADFRADWIADLQSGDIGKVIGVLDAIVLDHNMPSDDDTIAESMGQVDPYEGLLRVAGELFEAIAKLPPR